MLQRLRALFPDRVSANQGRHKHDELSLAVAVLLIEAARQDGTFDGEERAVIRGLIVERLQIVEVDDLMSAAEDMAADAVENWSFAQVAKNSFGYDERVELIEMMWEVVYADGVLHDYEANLLRRMAGLLYVSDRDSGDARRRVRERLSLNGD